MAIEKSDNPNYNWYMENLTYVITQLGEYPSSQFIYFEGAQFNILDKNELNYLAKLMKVGEELRKKSGESEDD